MELHTAKEAKAFAYEPYPRDDELQTVVTSCAHNCGSRHMLVAHKKGDVIVRLSTDDGRYQQDGHVGKDTEEEPQLRACLRGRSYRQRLYSAERLLYPMGRVGKRGEGKFKRISWDQALDYVARKMIEIKNQYGSTALLDQSYAGASYGVLHKSDQIEGLLGRFLGMFGCRTNSWSVPSYQGTTTSSRWTFGTIEDGNEDDAFAHSKLIIMWGWNPAYTFHGGNTFYYMRMAKQRGCKFVLVDPQYTDSAAAYDAWWIPIKPNTDAAMMAGMAHYIFTNNLHDQDFINRFTMGMDAGTMPDWAQQSANGKENFKDYILGTYDGVPKTPEWAADICGVSAEQIKKLADMYARTKPAALKASWAPGRNAYGEQYNRMAAALQAMTGNIGVLGGCAEGVGKAWHSEAVAYPYDQYANIWFASIKSDRWAHCVLNYPNVKREEIGCWPRQDATDGHDSQHQGDLLAGFRLVQPAHQHQQRNRGDQEARAGGVHGFDHHPVRACGRTCCCRSPPTSNVTTSPCPGTRATTTSTGPRSSNRWANRRPTSRSSPNWPTGSATRTASATPSARPTTRRPQRSYFNDPDAVDEAYLRAWWEQKVMAHQHVDMSWDEFKKHGVYKFKLDKPHVAFREQIENGKPFQTPSGKIEILCTELASISDWTKTKYGYHIPSIPKWIEPWESLNSPKTAKYPFHLISPHPRWRTHSIFNNCSWLRETYEQEVTIATSDAKRLGIKTGDTVEVFNERGRVVVPAYVTERTMPGVAVLHEGAWMDLDENGVDRSGNPDFLTLDEPSPAGAFAYNTVLCDIKKTDLEHRPGWDELATSRAHVFRRDQ